MPFYPYFYHIIDFLLNDMSFAERTRKGANVLNMYVDWRHSSVRYMSVFRTTNILPRYLLWDFLYNILFV